jgi:hypothetical protein
MLLDYYTKREITKILKPSEFNPIALADGRYIVNILNSKTEFIEYEIINTGWVRDYKEWNKINKLNIVEVELSKTDRDDKSIVMTELTSKVGMLNV